MYTLWAYIFASIGMICGIFVLLKYKWKLGTWIICFSLSVFVGGNLQIGSLVNYTLNITKKIEGIESKIQKLDVKVNQTVALKQEVSQTVNVITEVKKEIANIKETIHQHFNAIANEVFNEYDENIKIKLIHISELENESALFFMLNKIPEPNSIKIINNKGGVVPFTSLRTIRNIIMVSISGLSALFPNNKDYFEVSYTPNFYEKKPLLSLEDIEMEKVDKGIINFKLKEK